GMKSLTAERRNSGGRRRLAAIVFKSKSSGWRRRHPQQARRLRSPEFTSRHQALDLAAAVLTTALSIALLAPTAELRAKEDATADASPAPKSPVDQLIPWLLDERKELRGIAFSEVIFDTTGKRVLPI